MRFIPEYYAPELLGRFLSLEYRAASTKSVSPDDILVEGCHDQGTHHQRTKGTSTFPRLACLATVNFRDYLLAALNTLPDVRELHIHVLLTAPAKHSSLYPYASPRPVSMPKTSSFFSPSKPTQTLLASLSQPSGLHLPRSCHRLRYPICIKSGFDRPGSRAITHRDSREGIHSLLFARAQGQYLFPNSSNYPGKRPPSDARLCAWWRRVLGQVAGEVHEAMDVEGRVDMYYVLPGHSELEAQQVVGTTSLPSNSSSTSTPLQWVYGHPYSQTDIPLPCPPPEGLHNLGHYIPSFEDDPKNRFMDEIAFTDTPVSPRKRTRTDTPRSEEDALRSREGEKGKDKKKETTRPGGDLSKVSPDEFWERLSSRRECVVGAVTGFFSVGISVPEHPWARDEKVCAFQSSRGVELSTLERARKATDVIEQREKGVMTVTTTTKVSRLAEYLDTLDAPRLMDDEIALIDEAGAKEHHRRYVRRITCQ
ncbi:histone acetylation protein-domain-containing protein [Lactifluus volemus]|nr:histone acetylation protein-domain-containing protein [Lactifluus volemus]